MIIVDTGPLVALAGAGDNHHTRCRDWFTQVDRRLLVVPAPVIAEACHLTGHHCGAGVEAAFLNDLAQGSYGTISAVLPQDLARMSALAARYADLPPRRYRRLRRHHRRTSQGHRDRHPGAPATSPSPPPAPPTPPPLSCCLAEMAGVPLLVTLH